ncbi:MAG: phosphoribosyltransferase [Fervidicoccaceae archaeon]
MSEKDPQSDRFLTLSWKDIEEASITIAEKIGFSGFNPQVIVGVLRGGWIPARILSDLLDIKEVGALEIKFYRGIEERSERPVITQPLVRDVKDKNVLIVDDVADTGKSLQVALGAVSLYGPKQIKSVSLYVKPWSVIVPDFYYAQTDKWIIFPWEKRETVQTLVEAEYRILSRTSIDGEKASKELSQKTGLEQGEIKRILNLIIGEKKSP